MTTRTNDAGSGIVGTQMRQTNACTAARDELGM